MAIKRLILILAVLFVCAGSVEAGDVFKFGGWLTQRPASEPDTGTVVIIQTAGGSDTTSWFGLLRPYWKSVSYYVNIPRPTVGEDSVDFKVILQLAIDTAKAHSFDSTGTISDSAGHAIGTFALHNFSFLRFIIVPLVGQSILDSASGEIWIYLNDN